jgi:hypothetical protein
MARTGRPFTAEYREGAGHRVIGTDRQIAEVERELDVGEQLLGRWVPPPDRAHVAYAMNCAATQTQLPQGMPGPAYLDIPFRGWATLVRSDHLGR